MVFAVTRIAHRLTDKNNAMSGINYLDREFFGLKGWMRCKQVALFSLR
jgi:hypothetical protein